MQQSEVSAPTSHLPDAHTSRPPRAAQGDKAWHPATELNGRRVWLGGAEWREPWSPVCGRPGNALVPPTHTGSWRQAPVRGSVTEVHAPLASLRLPGCPEDPNSGNQPWVPSHCHNLLQRWDQEHRWSQGRAEAVDGRRKMMGQRSARPHLVRPQAA